MKPELRTCIDKPTAGIGKLKAIAAKYAYTGELSKDFSYAARLPSKGEKSRVGLTAYAKIVAPVERKWQIFKDAEAAGIDVDHMQTMLSSDKSSCSILFVSESFYSFDGEESLVIARPEFKEWQRYKQLLKEYRTNVLCGAHDLNSALIMG